MRNGHIQEGAQSSGASRMFEFLQGLGLYLAHAFAGHLKDTAHLFQGARAAVGYAKTLNQDLLLPFSKSTQGAVHFFF